MYARGDMYVPVPPKSLIRVILLAVAVFGGFAAVTRTWTFKIYDIDPDDNYAVLVSEGDLGSRMYALCASQALSEAAGMKMRVKWLSDPWVPATRFHDLFDNPFDIEDLVSRIDADSFIDVANWKSWREEAKGELFWKKGSEWHCRRGTQARDSDLLKIAQPAWLRQLPIPTGLYVTSRAAGCNMWGPKHYIDPCLVADQISNCYRNLQPSIEVIQLLDETALEHINASTGVLYQTGPPTETPPPPPSCSSIREGFGRRLFQDDSNLEKISIASATSQRSQLLPDTVEAFSPQYCLLEWEKQARGTTKRMMDAKRADQDMKFIVGGALPAALDIITEQFLEEARPIVLRYPTEPIKVSSDVVTRSRVSVMYRRRRK